MNALRSSSAFARRSLATPPSAPLSSSSRLLSSSSFTSSLSSRTISSASLSQRTNRVNSSSRWSGSIPSLYLTQSRTMASETKIKVKNPLVELDGDEVWEQPLPFIVQSLKRAVSQACVSSCSAGAIFVEIAGKHGAYHDIHVSIPPMMTLHNA
jgi:hypothetical protein